MTRAFGEDRADDVEILFKHLYRLARESVLRNSGRYLYGVLLFGGLADPDFAHVVFEAFAHWKAKPGRPALRTALGLRLEVALKESDGKLKGAARDFFETLMSTDNWTQIKALMAILKKDRASFVLAIVAAEDDSFVTFTLRSWRAALSLTHPTG